MFCGMAENLPTCQSFWTELPTDILIKIMTLNVGTPLTISPGRTETIDENTTNEETGKKLYKDLGAPKKPFWTASKDGNEILAYAHVCRIWRDVGYRIMEHFCVKLSLPWSIQSEFGDVHCANEVIWCIKHGLTMCLSPTDALLSTLTKSMKLAPDRFKNVQELHLGNYLVGPNDLKDFGMFPNLRKLFLVGVGDTSLSIESVAALVWGCPKLEILVMMYFEEPELIIILEILAQLKDLKKFYYRTKKNKWKNISSKSIASVGFGRCSQCTWFVPLSKEKEKTCLFHPGHYSGYGSSCSSFDCCGSMKPGYPYTPGCKYGEHVFDDEKRIILMYRDPVYEFLDTPYEDGLFPRGRFWFRDPKEIRCKAHGRFRY